MKTGLTKPEWDTPSNGDFAAYVERLSAAEPARKPAAPSSLASAGPAPRKAAGASAAQPSPSTSTATMPSAAQALPPDLVRQLAPLGDLLRTARTWLLVLIGLHFMALLIFGWGSVAFLVIMGMFWWAVGWLVQSLPRPAVAQQRKAAKKK